MYNSAISYLIICTIIHLKKYYFYSESVLIFPEGLVRLVGEVRWWLVCPLPGAKDLAHHIFDILNSKIFMRQVLVESDAFFN